MKWRIPALLLLIGACAVCLLAANIRLYLKDGTFQIVKEYQVQQDRVKYLSAERNEWEEIPLDLIDLNRTKEEATAHQQQLAAEQKEDADEAAVVREEKQRVDSVPDETGAYYVRGEMLDALKQADITVTHDKKRTILKILSPVPLVPGKNTVDIDGPASKFHVDGDRPEFYFRLEAVEGFGMIKLDPKKTARQVETVTIEAVTNELREDRNEVATFTKQAGDQLFKIWPEKPLLPGEYALIEYSAEQGHLMVWDFAVGGGAAAK